MTSTMFVDLHTRLVNYLFLSSFAAFAFAIAESLSLFATCDQNSQQQHKKKTRNDEEQRDAKIFLPFSILFYGLIFFIRSLLACFNVILSRNQSFFSFPLVPNKFQCSFLQSLRLLLFLQYFFCFSLFVYRYMTAFLHFISFLVCSLPCPLPFRLFLHSFIHL